MQKLTSNQNKIYCKKTVEWCIFEFPAQSGKLARLEKRCIFMLLSFLSYPLFPVSVIVWPPLPSNSYIFSFPPVPFAITITIFNLIFFVVVLKFPLNQGVPPPHPPSPVWNVRVRGAARLQSFLSFPGHPLPPDNSTSGFPLLSSLFSCTICHRLEEILFYF